MVEVDGAVHIERNAYDSTGDRYLRPAGLRVLRLANEQVLVDLESTLKLIALTLLPLSASGEGAGG